MQDEITKKMIQEAGLEQPSAGFVRDVMNAIEVKSTSTVYRPLIGRRGWTAIAAVVVISLVVVYLMPSEGSSFFESLNLPTGASIPNPMEKIEVSQTMLYAIGFLGLFLLQIPFLKRRFEF
ncbi:MAG: hypothetical protein HKO54_03010 [Flavobacteriaceae bacterium]|nr:hypothetical protein [Flavobacteriaceae bacterium]